MDYLAYATTGSSRDTRRQWIVKLRRDDGHEMVVSGSLPETGARTLAEKLNAFLQATLPTTPQVCQECGTAIKQATEGRTRLYCSHRCRQIAYRARHDQATPASPSSLERKA